MSNLNHILTYLASSKSFSNYISKVHPSHLQDDLRSEVYLAISNMNEEKLKNVVDTNKIANLAVSIARNMIASNTSKFYKQYRHQEKLDYKTFDNVNSNASINIDTSFLSPNDMVFLEELLKYKNLKEFSDDRNIKYSAVKAKLSKIRAKGRIYKEGTEQTVVVKYKIVTANKSEQELVNIDYLISKALEGYCSDRAMIVKIEPSRVFN